MLKKLLKNKVISNMSWMMLSSIAQMVISLIINSFTARYLGPSNYGVINYVTSYVTMFTPICQLGLYSIVVKEVVTDIEHRGEIIGSALFIRTLLGLFSTISIISIVFVLKKADTTYLTVAFFCSIKLIFDAFEIVKYWYQSQLKYKNVAIISMIAYLGMSIYRIILLKNNSDVIWFGLSTTIDSFIIAVGLALIYHIDKSPKFAVRMKTIKELLLKSKNLFLSALVAGVGGQINTILLGQLLNSTVVGFYTCAASCCSIFAFIPGAIIDSLRPEIMKAKEVSDTVYRKRLSETISIIAYLSFAFVVVIILLANPIVSILYGEAFLPAVSVLRVYAVGFFLSYIGVIRTIWFVCEKKLKYERNIALFSATFSIVLSSVLVSAFGLEGAVANYLIIQICTHILITGLSRNTRDFQTVLMRGITLKDIKIIDHLKRRL